MAETVLIALGSNVGDRAAWLCAARSAIACTPGVRLAAASPVEETAPLGARMQAPYLNQMIAVRTSLTPQALLSRLQQVERALGRVRTVRWGARTIDLDIVRFGHHSLDTPALVLPHPGLRDRDFWQREVEALVPWLGEAA